MNLTQFIKSDLRNAWIKERYINVYVRKSMRLLDDKGGRVITKCLDIASVDVVESRRGNGIFTSFRIKLEEAAKQCNRWVFVECVQNQRLSKHLPTVGYYRVTGCSDIAPNFYKPTDSHVHAKAPDVGIHRRLVCAINAGMNEPARRGRALSC